MYETMKKTRIFKAVIAVILTVAMVLPMQAAYVKAENPIVQTIYTADPSPVVIGDTIYVRTKVLDKRESKSKDDRGIVYVESIAYNQNGVDVLSFRRHVLIKKRNNG